MRADARIPQTVQVLATVEGSRWLVELLLDTTVKVTIDRGSGVGSIAHQGTRASVRTRLAVDADTRDLASLDAAVRDIL